MNKTLNIYEESMRYIDNAKEILSTKAGKEGQFYNDAKYVRMACNTAYSGLLLAIDGLLKTKNIQKQKGKSRISVDVSFYRDNLAKMNQTVLKNFNTAYNYLHLLGGYDGDLHINTAKTGIENALRVIEWVKKQIN